MTATKPELRRSGRDLYEVLGVDRDVSQPQIKRAFRQRAKEIHPDLVRGDRDTLEQMRELIHAYETLSRPGLREEYDRGLPKQRSEQFDYRSFLKQQEHQPDMLSKLIFFELLHDHADEAIHLYERLVTVFGHDLSDHLDREDFMDCAFLLAEEYESNGRLMPAYRLLKAIALLERERPYFRHFFDEVVDRLRALTCQKMPHLMGDDDALVCIQEMIDLGFSNKETAFYLKKAAELHLNRREIRSAEMCLRKGMALDQKLAGVKKLQQRIFDFQVMTPGVV